MGWARIDDGFDDHPKILALLEHDDGGAAVGLWTLCLTWAHRNTRKAGKVPGLIPSSLPRRYLGHGARDLAKLLVAERLWDERTEGDGWLIHDFDRYLPTAETREARSEAGKRGAQKRWGSKQANSKEPKEDGNLPESDSNLPSSSHDAASKPMASDGSRAPAHRVIPNGITPEPAPVPEPLVLVGDQSSVEGGPGGDAAQAPPKQKRGTRIPDNFADSITPEMVAWAQKRCPHIDGKLETEKFVNHWQSAAGRGATKLDWNKAWQNWLLTAEQQAPRGRASPGRGQQPSPADHRDEWKFNRA
ncbi:MAG TPA: hypothetical protein VHZ03_32650 [Trebonia sp.]|jgi:hypothetical protein|nr:hypothetical protein [Trebonia sp.]